MDFSKVTVPIKTDLLIAFVDIQGLRNIADVLRDPVKLFGLLNSWAQLIIKEMEGTDGKVLKFIGDECLIAFPEQSADAGIRTLLAIKDKVEKRFEALGFANKLRITAHFGEVVNTAAGLGRGEHRGRFIMSAQAFRKLSPTTRKRFHKYTPPIVYLAEET